MRCVSVGAIVPDLLREVLLPSYILRDVCFELQHMGEQLEITVEKDQVSTCMSSFCSEYIRFYLTAGKVSLATLTFRFSVRRNDREQSAHCDGEELPFISVLI